MGLVAWLVANTYYNNIFSNDAMLHQLMQTQIFLQRTPPSVHSPSHLPLCYCRFEIFFSFSPSYLNLFFRYHYNWRRLEKELKNGNGLNTSFNHSRGICINSHEGSLYIADQHNYLIIKLTMQGIFIPFPLPSLSPFYSSKL